MTEQTAMTVREEMGLSDTLKLADTLAQSGYFSDAKQAAQAAVKVLAGRELGFGPIASMTGIHIIQGRVAVGANLMASAVKRDPRYNYLVTNISDEGVTIAFFEGKAEIGQSVFTVEDARRAGTQNMGKFPRNMLFARAMSNGVKWFCPDVGNGQTMYTPEELGAEVDDDGNVIDVTPTVTKSPEPTASTQPTRNTKPTRPYSPETVKAGIASRCKNDDKTAASQKQKGLVASKLDELFAGDADATAKRHTLMQYLIGKESTSAITKAEANALLKWALDDKDDGQYNLDKDAITEAGAIIRQAHVDAGQTDMFDAPPEDDPFEM